MVILKSHDYSSHNMTITTPPNYKRPVSVLFNEELTTKTSLYSDFTQAPKKRNHTDESNTDKDNTANDQIPSNKIKNQSNWMYIDTCTTYSNSNNLTSTTWKEDLNQLKQEMNNNIKNYRRKPYTTNQNI